MQIAGSNPTTGNVYVTDYGNNRIQVFDSNGNFLTKFASFGRGEGQFQGPEGIAADSSGNVYVSDIGNSRVQVFAPDINPSISSNGGNVNGENPLSTITGNTTANINNSSSTTTGNTTSNNESPTPTPTPSQPVGITDQL